MLRWSVLLCCLLVIHAGGLQAQACVEYAESHQRLPVPELTGAVCLDWSEGFLFSYRDREAAGVLEVGEITAGGSYRPLASVEASVSAARIVAEGPLCALWGEGDRLRVYRFDAVDGLLPVLDHTATSEIATVSLDGDGCAALLGPVEDHAPLDVWSISGSVVTGPVRYELPGGTTGLDLVGDTTYCGESMRYGPTSLVVRELDGAGSFTEIGRQEIWNVNDGELFSTGRVPYLEVRGDRALMEISLAGFGINPENSFGETRLFLLDTSNSRPLPVLDSYPIYQCSGAMCGPGLDHLVSWQDGYAITGEYSEIVLRVDPPGELRKVAELPTSSDAAAACSGGLFLTSYEEIPQAWAWDLGDPPLEALGAAMSCGFWSSSSTRPISAEGDSIAAGAYVHPDGYAIRFFRHDGDGLDRLPREFTAPSELFDMVLRDGIVYAACEDGVSAWNVEEGIRTGPWTGSGQARLLVEGAGRLCTVNAGGDLLIHRGDDPSLPPLGTAQVGVVEDVLLRGDVLYLAGDGLRVIDVSEAGQLQVITAFAGTPFRRLASVADRLYAATDDEVYILGLADPLDPVEVHRFMVEGIRDIAGRRDRLVISTVGGQELFDLSQPDSPWRLGALYRPLASPTVATSYGFVISDEFTLTPMLPDCASEVAVEDPAGPPIPTPGAYHLAPPAPTPSTPAPS